jgi:hypothetical protein
MPWRTRASWPIVLLSYCSATAAHQPVLCIVAAAYGGRTTDQRPVAVRVVIVVPRQAPVDDWFGFQVTSLRPPNSNRYTKCGACSGTRISLMSRNLIAQSTLPNK